MTMLGTNNRVLAYAAKIQAQIDAGTKPDGSPLGDLVELEKTLALSVVELVAYQNAKSRAQLAGTISIDEAMTIYAALGEGSTSGWAAGTTLAMKITVTNLMGQLLQAVR